jgi:glycosyltransferase involved in cell wall biosynthesis
MIPEGELAITYIKLPHDISRIENYPTIVEAIKQYDIEIFFASGFYANYLKQLKEENVCKLVYVLHGMPLYEKFINNYIFNQPEKRSVKAWLKHYLLTIPKHKLGYYNRRILNNYKRRYHDTDAYGVLLDSYGKQVAKVIGVDYNNSHIYTLSNPLPEAEYNPCECQRQKRLVYVGRLGAWDKQLWRLLAVWKILQNSFLDWELCFVGDGEDRDNLENIVISENLQRVKFLGWHNDPSKFFRTSEIFCMTSIAEGVPMSILEAQQCGCATIAFNCSYGIQETLSPNWENGVYVPNGDIKAYAEALAHLMSDDELRQKIQKNGIENVKRFSIERSVEQYDSVIKRVLKQ